jgi:Glycine/sarcosine/betaine reductase component B subunits/Glycine/sarcosine/betaine reductase selenoprotein B (GRDB)
MQLILAIHPITEIRFGENTRLDGTVLVTAKDELRRLASQVPGIESVDFEIVHPGESCRAGPIFDIVEPRAKAPDGSPDWPGILGASQTAGSGTTHVLNGAAVTLLREESPSESRGVTGFVLEMSGEAASASHYAKRTHLIIRIANRARADPQFVRQDPNRLVPLDVMRELEQEGVIGELYDEFISTSGLANPLSNTRRMGGEMAEKAKRLGIDAIILTST